MFARRSPAWTHGCCLLGFLAAACHSRQPALPSGPEPRPGASELRSDLGHGDPSYLVVYRPGPRWPTDDSMPPVLRDHFRYLRGLHRAGTLQLGGPFAVQAGGAAVLRARDDDTARALLQADPAVSAQVFDFELRRWSLVDWAAHAADAPN